MPRCAWTNMVSERVKEVSLPDVDWIGRERGSRTVFVLPEYESDLRAYAERRRRYLRVFYGMVGLLVLASVFSQLVAFRQGTPLIMIAAGLLVWSFPFATTSTVESYGARASIRIARTAALVLAGIGAGLLVSSNA